MPLINVSSERIATVFGGHAVEAKSVYCRHTLEKVRARIPESHIGKIAEEAGIDKTKLWRYLNDQGGLFPGEWFSLARVLQCTVDFLFDDNKTDNSPLGKFKTYPGKVARKPAQKPAQKPPKKAKRKPPGKGGSDGQS